MRITVAQLNPVVGAVDDNTTRIINVIEQASRDGADLAVLPELIVTGYPPKDLLERPAFIAECESALERITRATADHGDLGVILGCPLPTGDNDGKPLYNKVVLASGGRRLFEQAKILLPMYDVFDEARYFKPAADNAACEFKGHRLGLSICEDLWYEPDPWNRRPYMCDPIEMLARKNAGFLINISASPFSVGKEKVRYDLIRNHTRKFNIPFLFVNQVGGNDDLVFDGRSLYVDATGRARHVLPGFEEVVRTIDTDEDAVGGNYEYEDELHTIHRALVMGTRDYVRKCGFERVVIGLSGGVDSAVTAAVAVEALGADKVLGIAMPSPYTSQASKDDARALSVNLGIELEVVPISDAMAAYEKTLGKKFAGEGPSTTEENIQARIRGNIIMAYSNKFGYLPLSTGNKSELAVGYCTLYGDMSGGLAVISDVPKTLVYKLAALINGEEAKIPANILARAPSAELRPNQTDQDTLPPYETLDEILECYIDNHLSPAKIVERGFDEQTVNWVVDTVRKNEYKRKQAAPGLKVTSKAFGTGRRMPIAARYDV